MKPIFAKAPSPGVRLFLAICFSIALIAFDGRSSALIHFRNMLEMDGEAAGQLFACIPTIARKVMKATDAKGMNIINNNEEIAGQTVFHTHVHLAPRYTEDDDLNVTFVAHEPDFPALAALAEKISNA